MQKNRFIVAFVVYFYKGRDILYRYKKVRSFFRTYAVLQLAIALKGVAFGCADDNMVEQLNVE